MAYSGHPAQKEERRPAVDRRSTDMTIVPTRKYTPLDTSKHNGLQAEAGSDTKSGVTYYSPIFLDLNEWREATANGTRVCYCEIYMHAGRLLPVSPSPRRWTYKPKSARLPVYRIVVKPKGVQACS